MTELRLRRPEFVPARVLDYGCGPGTALMAIDHVWPGQITKATAIEPSSGMEWIATQIMGDELKKVVEFNHYSGDDLPQSQKSSFDMVVASYVLSELATPKARRRMMRSLWARVRPGGVLVVIEPGTPIGFGCVREARHVVLGVGEHAKETGGTPVEGRATTIAPCPHDGMCPLDLSNTWCHFGQRVRRTTLLRASKSGVNNFEDEKFSYAILERMTPEAVRAADAAKQAAAEAAAKPRRGRPKKVDVFARVLTPPRKRGGHVMARACISDGEVTGIMVPHSAGHALYTSARKSGWGDVLHHMGAVRRDSKIMQSLLPRKPIAKTDEAKEKEKSSDSSLAPVQARAKRAAVEPFADDDDELMQFAREAHKERKQNNNRR
jgi:ribosomal protein RSM22 (predicted rRNA methylase)